MRRLAFIFPWLFFVWAVAAYAQFTPVGFPPGTFSNRGALDATPPSGPVVTDLGNKNQFGSSTTITITTAAAVAAGKLVVVFVNDGAVSISGATVGDTKSNTYTLITTEAAVASQNILMFYSFVTTPLTTSDVITYTNANIASGVTLNISALSASPFSAIDSATTNQSGNGFASTYTVTGASSAAVANEIYFGFAVSNSTFTGTPTGWNTNPPSTPLSGNFLAAWQVNAGTSALTFNGSTTGSQFTGALIASFKP